MADLVKIALPKLPAEQPFVGQNGKIDPIWLRWFNQFRNLLAQGVSVDGSAITSGTIDPSRIVFPDTVVETDGSRPFVGDQSLGHHRLTDLAYAVGLQDAVSVEYLDAQLTTGIPQAIRGEVPTGSIDGSNTVFTTAQTYGTTLEVFLNGLRMTKGADYTESGAATFTMLTAPAVADTLVVNYRDASAPIGGLVLLKDVATSGGVTHVDLSGWQSSAYDAYVLELVGIVVSTTANLALAFSTDGGTTFAPNYNYNWVAIPGLAATTGSIAGALNLGAGTNLAGAGHWSGSLRIYMPSGLDVEVNGFVACHNGGNSNVQNLGGGYPNSLTGPANFIRLSCSAGTMSAGAARIYGMVK